MEKDNLCYSCLAFVMLLRLFIAALWSPAGKGLTFWLLFVMFNCDFFTFPCDILVQVWYLILLIPDICCLSDFKCNIHPPIYHNYDNSYLKNLLKCAICIQNGH